MANIVYFDLETQRSFSEVGGYENKQKMGISVAVTYSTLLGEYRIFPESEAHALVEQLSKADLVVGFNHLNFDYAVLESYTVFDMLPQTRNLDILVDVEAVLGHRLKLDSIAEATLGKGKTADGLNALRWWQEHKRTGDIKPLLMIAEYCAHDVKVTKLVHEYGVEHGHIKFTDRQGQVRECAVNWAKLD